MQHAPIPINPELLKWVRKDVGLELHEAAERAKLTTSKEKDGIAMLSAWEQGIGTPNLPQLKKIAKAYRYPLVAFFLSEPPKSIDILKDFRTLESGEIGITPEFEAFKTNILLIYRELKALAEDEGAKPLSFVGSLSKDIGVKKFVHAMRETLDITLQEQQRQTSKEEFFKYLRELAHDAGIFVLVDGDLANHATRIEPEIFRGIAIADELVPLIVINKYDAKAAQLFTLIHELAHIWLGFTGITNTDSLSAMVNSRHDERFCNQVAAEFLVPEDEIRKFWQKTHDLETHIKSLAQHFKVSEEVISRRSLDLKLISSQEYNKLTSMYRARLAHLKEIAKNKNSNFGDFYRDRRIKLGSKTIRTLIDAAYDGRITLQEASRLLNVPVSRFPKVSE